MSYEKTDGWKNSRGLLVASVLLATGLLTATLLGTQLFSSNAVAQESNSNGTSIDQSCPPDATICEQQIDNGSTSNSSQLNASDTATLSTTGTATTKVQPDKVSVTVGIETNGTTAQEASSKNANLTAKVLGALTGLGIPKEQISTSNYQVYPVYAMNQPINSCKVMEGYPIPPECYVNQQIITGYKAFNSLTVTLDVDGDVNGGQVIDTAIEAGANNVNGVFFFMSSERQEEIRDGLIADSIQNAKHRADAAAKAAGMEVSGVKSINLNDVYFPFFSKGSDASLREAGAPSTQLQPGEQEVTMTVSVVYSIS
jgi:uncharacterized protein